jgi:hypothetical protein
MTPDEALKTLKSEFIHSPKGLAAIETIEKDYLELKRFRDHWHNSINRSYEQPHVMIEEEL